jgi:hypothetical protein
MDFFSLAALFFLAVGGVALDAYQHPKTLDITIVHRSDDTGTPLDRGMVIGIVSHELDRMARVTSLLARPHLRPSEEKGFVEALGNATGTTAILDVIASTVQDPPDSLNLGVYSEGSKLKAYVFGSVSDVPTRDGRFDLIDIQGDGETAVDTVRRATVDGASRIDPYLAMLYLLSEQERTGQEHFATSALAIAQHAEHRIPPSAGLLLLSRLQNTEGLVQLRLGKLDQARAAFESGLSHVPPGEIGLTPVILRLNNAFIDLALNDIDAAAARLAEVDASTNNFAKLADYRISTSEGTTATLRPDQVGVLRSIHAMLLGVVAFRRNQMDEAVALLQAALRADPHQLGAISLLADIDGLNGHPGQESSLRAEVAVQSVSHNPYVEVAPVHATLSVTSDAVVLKPPEYLMR